MARFKGFEIVVVVYCYLLLTVRLGSCYAALCIPLRPSSYSLDNLLDIQSNVPRWIFLHSRRQAAVLMHSMLKACGSNLASYMELHCYLLHPSMVYVL